MTPQEALDRISHRWYLVLLKWYELEYQRNNNLPDKKSKLQRPDRRHETKEQATHRSKNAWLALLSRGEHKSGRRIKIRHARPDGTLIDGNGT